MKSPLGPFHFPLYLTKFANQISCLARFILSSSLFDQADEMIYINDDDFKDEENIDHCL